MRYTFYMITYEARSAVPYGLWAPPGDHLNPGIEPTSLASLALVGGFFTTSATWEAPLGAGVMVKSSI